MSLRDKIALSSQPDITGVPAFHEITAMRMSGSGNNPETKIDYVADETPVALIYNGEPHVVMLATPCDLEDFAMGFSLSEGLIEHPDEIEFLDITPCQSGIQIHIRIPQEREISIGGRQRNLAGRTGCGLCGTALIEDAVKDTPQVLAEVKVRSDALLAAVSSLFAHQPLNAMTGAVHAAAWTSLSGKILKIREDVGRHNALDKLIGAIYQDTETNLAEGFIIVTSRASYEMVSKSAFAGIAIIVAISAPTSLAIKIARKSNITLAGFAREGSYVIYTNPQRIVS